MSNIKPFLITNFKDGIITEGVISESLMPAGAVAEAINVHFDKMGSVELRKGLTLLGSQISAGNTILGLHQFLDEGAGTNNQLLAVVNTVTYYLASGTWTSKRTGLTANKKARFTNFLDSIFMVNGADAMNTWDADPATSFTTTNTVSAPVASFIDNYRSRVWAANTSANPSRLWYSSVAATDGTIDWTSSDSSYIDIAPGDGEDITGIIKSPRALLVFKNNHIYRVYNIHETEPDAKIFVGTYSQESIVSAKDGVYFHHPSGIYRIRTGESLPVEISKPIYDFIKNISSSFYTNVGGWKDNDHIYMSLGNITINGISFTNVVARWTISTEVWTIYSYTTQLRLGTDYDDGSNILQVVGDNNGNVLQLNTGNDDNGGAIFYSLITGWHNFDGLRSETKTITKLASLHKNAQGIKLEWQNENMKNFEWESVGMLDSKETIFEDKNIKGHKIRFRLSGNSKGGQWQWDGLELLEGINEGVI